MICWLPVVRTGRYFARMNPDALPKLPIHLRDSHSQEEIAYAKQLTVVSMFLLVLHKLVSNILFSLKFLEVLDPGGFRKARGRLNKSPNFRRNPTSWCRSMATKQQVND